jgi:ketosteroid isomerase-like protein
LILTKNNDIMATKQVADRFYALSQEGKWDLILDELYSQEAVSVEPEHAHGLKSVNGLNQIKDKAKQWNAMIQEMHGGYSGQPQVAGNFFSVAMGMDVTMKGQPRSAMDEIALYEVKDGKIVKEQFFF